MPSVGDPDVLVPTFILTTTGHLRIGTATVVIVRNSVSESSGHLRIGTASNVSLIRAVGAKLLECCREVAVSGGSLRIGTATWVASPLHDGDSLARYYPLYLDDHELTVDAKGNSQLLERLRQTGRDIAHHVDASATGAIKASDNGKMCEIPEQFRTDRFYDVPLTRVLDPQPTGKLASDPNVLQFEWSHGFTVTLLYRYRRIRQEQTLFSVSPSLRCGVTWFGELVVELQLENGDEVDARSTIRLQEGEWSHVAFAYDPDRKLIRAQLNGQIVISLPFERALAPIDGAYIGQWDGGSLMNGDAQDVRIYDSAVRPEFVSAETNSYCADWVEVVT